MKNQSKNQFRCYILFHSILRLFIVTSFLQKIFFKNCLDTSKFSFKNCRDVPLLISIFHSFQSNFFQQPMYSLSYLELVDCKIDGFSLESFKE